MVNGYCMYKEWFAVRYLTKHAKKQTDFRVAVIKQLLPTCNQERTHRHVSRNVAGCLADILYIKSLLMEKKVQRVCVACAPGERRINKSMGINNKRA